MANVSNTSERQPPARDAYLFTGLMVALAAVAALFVRERAKANASREAP